MHKDDHDPGQMYTRKRRADTCVTGVTDWTRRSAGVRAYNLIVDLPLLDGVEKTAVTSSVRRARLAARHRLTSSPPPG